MNGTTYLWMGKDGSELANITNIQITPTRTIFVMQAGPMNVTITFLSPVEVRSSRVVMACSLPEDGGAISPTTGSSSRSRFPTFLWKLDPLTETATLCNCTQILLQV